MKPVMQTEFGERGDCVRACVASILELKVEDVPHFLLDDDGEIDEDGATGRLVNWLALRNKRLRHVWVWPGFHKCLRPICYCMGAGKSPRGITAGHMVVYQGGVLAHDPHPDGQGLDGGPEEYLFIIDA